MSVEEFHKLIQNAVERLRRREQLSKTLLEIAKLKDAVEEIEELLSDIKEIIGKIEETLEGMKNEA